MVDGAAVPGGGASDVLLAAATIGGTILPACRTVSWYASLRRPVGVTVKVNVRALGDRFGPITTLRRTIPLRQGTVPPNPRTAG